MSTWAEIVERTIRETWPQVKENLLRTAELDAKLRARGIPLRPMPAILREAIKIAQRSPNRDA
jgi:hypothetical protein